MLERYKAFLRCPPDTVVFMNLRGEVLEVWEGQDRKKPPVNFELLDSNAILEEVGFLSLNQIHTINLSLSDHTWVECRIVKYQKDEFLLILRNITESYKSKESLENQVQDRTNELKRINGDLQMFLYTASHDLQEPLQKIKGFGNRLSELSSNFTEEQKYFLSVILSGTHRMSDLLSDLLSFVRAGGDIDFSWLSLDSLIHDLITEFEWGDIVVVEEELPYIYGNYDMLYLLFQNLVNNAIKFQPKDQKPIVLIEYSCSENSHIISVIDNGIGINMSFKDKIFKIFERLHSRFDYPGTGVGLALCKKIAQKHNGDIKVTSIEGEGSNFTVYLPIG
jgi:signal transduction histidine kinase